MDEQEYFEIDFLQMLTQARESVGLDTEISDADHDIARMVAELNTVSPHVKVTEIDLCLMKTR
jgi:hypothetical protein